jgi:hypothetical protein
MYLFRDFNPLRVAVFKYAYDLVLVARENTLSIGRKARWFQGIVRREASVRFRLGIENSDALVVSNEKSLSLWMPGSRCWRRDCSPRFNADSL